MFTIICFPDEDSKCILMKMYHLLCFSFLCYCISNDMAPLSISRDILGYLV